MAHSNLESVKTHPKYDFTGGDLHVIAENTEFIIHRYFFERESAKFRSLLSSPSPGQPQQGSSKLTAIRLTEVTVKEFEKFLMVFYNPTYTLYPSTTASDWALILALADSWQFAEVAKLAIRELEKSTMSAIERIVLYQRHGLKLEAPELVVHYAEVGRRGFPLDLRESKMLALDTVVFLNQVMHAVEKAKSGEPTSPLSPTDNVALIKRVMEEINLKHAPSAGNKFLLAVYRHKLKTFRKQQHSIQTSCGVW
ncbi:hypothetical protein FB45DRAFT_752542 [Roridomyces roridus]|uniref:BTB domain-containing protein n=1 Tax=Roridomyces roridus TaxID=1738132 RepID=A0AAD7FJH8_9AGAR|nr:hypothetical protein FB45DRAFT_752542 [Roridomyces roridus]